MTAERKTLIVPNAPLHFATLVMLYLAPLVALAGLLFGVPMLAYVGAVFVVLGRFPLVMIQEKNLMASRRSIEIEPNSREIIVDGKSALKISEIENAFVFPRIDQAPSVRIYGKNTLMPALDIEVKDFDEAHELLEKIGYGAGEKSATFMTLEPALLSFLPLAICAPLLAFLPQIGHVPGPTPSYTLPLAAVIGAFTMALTQIRRRVTVTPDGVESVLLGRFRKWIPFSSVTKATRTLANGSLETRSQKPFVFRGTTALGAALTDGQRSQDQLVERAMDAFDAFELRENRKPVVTAEQVALPEEVTLLRTSWIGWGVTAGLFLSGFASILWQTIRHTGPHHRGDPPSVALILGTVAIALGVVANLLMSRDPSRRSREKVTPFRGGLAFGSRMVERDLLENAYFQPAPPPSAQVPKAYRNLVRVVFKGKRWRDSISILVKNEAEGQAILRAMRIDPAQSLSTFTVRAGIFSSQPLRIFFVVFAGAGWQLLRFIHGPYKLALVAVILLSWVNAFWPTKMKIGVDGVFIKSLRRSRFFAFPDIERIEQTKAGVSLVLGSGQRIAIATTTGNTAQNAESAAVFQRLRDGLAYAKNHSTGVVAHALARGSLPTRAWMDQLRALGKGEATDYRVAAVDTNDLWRVIEDPSLHEEERIAAAVALRVDDEAASRLRVAANLSASPNLQTALQAAADRNEELLERALEESDASELTKRVD